MLSVGSSPFLEGGWRSRGTSGARGRFAGGQDLGEESAEGDGTGGLQEANDAVPFLSLQSASGGLGFLLPRDI